MGTGGCPYFQISMVIFLSAGVVLGISAGFSPGPLQILVMSQTLTHGIKEGIKVAFAPLLTDLPIILVSTFVLSQLANFRAIIGFISLIGGLFVMYLACGSFRRSKFVPDIKEAEPQSLRKGAVVNALNPHPYLFWLSVGAPMIIKAWEESPIVAAAFITGFYACLVGSKVFIAALVSKSSRFFTGKAYMYLIRILGILLLIFAFFLFKEGLDLLGALG